MDEAGFVAPKTMLAVLPNIAFKDRKQVHISSHVDGSKWLNKVADIKDADGNPAFHVVSQSFKCMAHFRLEGPTCPCLGIYCPQYINVNEAIKELMNIVYPRGFESEVTGSSITSSDLKTSVTTPFTYDVVSRFKKRTQSLKMIDPVYAVIGFDPTYGGGTKSCAGLCVLVFSERMRKFLVSQQTFNLITYVQLII